MNALVLKPFDPADYLDDDIAMVEYLACALETSDPKFIADALGVVARAKGMKQLAQESGLSRESLYKSLSENGNPELSTLMKVLNALGITLTAKMPRTT